MSVHFLHPQRICTNSSYVPWVCKQYQKIVKVSIFYIKHICICYAQLPTLFIFNLAMAGWWSHRVLGMCSGQGLKLYTSSKYHLVWPLLLRCNLSCYRRFKRAPSINQAEMNFPLWIMLQTAAKATWLAFFFFVNLRPNHEIKDWAKVCGCRK